MQLEYLSRLMSMAKKSGPPRRLAVAAAGERTCLESVTAAWQERLVEPILFGDRPVIERILSDLGCDPTLFDIRHHADAADSARQAVESVAFGENQLLMKGLIQTGDLFHIYFDRRYGLREEDQPLSHVGLFEVPGYGRLFAMTDAAINLDLDEPRLVAICRNAVKFMHKLGWERPKVALLAATSRVNHRQPVTGRAKRVAERAAREIPDAVFQGPLAIDEAISSEAVQTKGTSGPICGDADVLVVPYLEVGNVFYKTLTAFHHAKVVGACLGGRAPVVLTSRSDSEETKLLTMALSCHLAGERR